MHELSIAQSIAEVVQVRAEEQHATSVQSVRLRIGQASGVLLDSLTFSFEMLASLNPLLRGARLLIERTPHRAYCRFCAHAFDVEQFVMCCPDCGAWSTEVVSGDEFDILDIEIEPQTEEASGEHRFP